MEKEFKFRLDEGQIECPDDVMVEVYRQKTPMEKIKIASDMWESAWQQLNATLRAMHPDWDDGAIRKEIIKRLSNEDDFLRENSVGSII